MAVGGAFLLLVAAAAWFDACKYIIPNTIPITLAVLFVAIAAFRFEHIAVLEHLGAGALVFCVGILAFRFNVLGGGDIKLLSAIALWVGLNLLPVFILAVALFGGVLALFLLAMRHLMGWAVRAQWMSVEPPVVFRPGEKVPYAIAIGAGSALVTPYLPLVSALS